MLLSKFRIQSFRESLSEKMCTRQFRNVIWDMINTLFLTTVAAEPTFCYFPLAIANITSQTSRAIFSNFFEEQCTQFTHNAFGIVTCPFSDNLSRNSCIQSSTMHTTNIEITECTKWWLKNNRKSIINFQAQKVVVVAYRRWSFTRVFNCKTLTGKVLVFG